ncbi:MAG: trypsin-like peptidase domain-containing protein [Clostridia bacterium]|nr:trypsin-like peptidase domain-containing protein [Clostridia bacterium]
MMKKRKTARLLSLMLALALFAVTAASCQFPFSLREQETESVQPSETPTAGKNEETGKTDTMSGAPTEAESEDLDFVTPTEEEGSATADKEQIPETENAVGTAYDVSEIVEAVMPAMVAITVKVKNVQSGIFGGSYEYESEGAGSGIIVAQDQDHTHLYILTNNHVVEDSHSISVRFVDGTECEATVKGAESSYDLAVLIVKTADMGEKTLAEVRKAKLGSSDSLRLGQGAVAIGNALGYGQSVTIGCISALGRTVESDAGASIPLIQTDAAINPGNSGGALLNMAGEVIGINSMKYASTEVEGMGYAIPISDALPIMQELIEQKYYDESERGYLGVGCIAATGGLYVSQVEQGSAADTAGLKKGDVITAVDGKSVKTVNDLTEFLSHKTAGDRIKISFLRNSIACEAEATLTLRPKV